LFFAESGIVAVRSVEEVADDADLGRFDVDVSKGDRWPVVGQGLLEGHGEEGGSGVASRVSNVVDADGAADFVEAVVLVRASNLAEDAVTRAIAGEGDSGGAGGEFSSGLVDLEDADQVSAEVRHDKEFAGGVGKHGVRVRLLLSVGARSRLGLGELQSLDGLGCTGDGELVCGESRGANILFDSRNETAAIGAAIRASKDAVARRWRRARQLWPSTALEARERPLCDDAAALPAFIEAVQSTGLLVQSQPCRRHTTGRDVRSNGKRTLGGTLERQIEGVDLAREVGRKEPDSKCRGKKSRACEN
jgi:hypothetical protein